MYKAVRFQPSSPDARANGQVLMPYVQVLEGSELEHLITEYGLDKLEATMMYPQQIVCDLQRQMVDRMGLFSGGLVAIGKGSIASIPFPPEVNSIEAALGMLHNIYQAIHQNIPPEEGWGYEKVSDTEIHIHFNAPYEPFAAYGYIFSIANMFKPRGTQVTVFMDEQADETVYRVQLS